MRSGDQTPTDASLRCGMLMMVLWRQRIPMRRNSILTATLTTIDSRMRGSHSRIVNLIKGGVIAIVDKLLIFKVSHSGPRVVWHTHDGVNDACVN